MDRQDDDRTGMDPDTLRRAVLAHLHFTLAKETSTATPNDAYQAVARTVWDRLVHRWISTQQRYAEVGCKRVCYLSMEYLLGKQLEQNLLTMGLRDLAETGAAEFGIRLDKILDEEPDPGLGNGGLGRLAACFMDSLATLGLPAMGYGLRYEFGIFRQGISDGWQVERPDEWLRRGNPWEVRRPEYTMTVPMGGWVQEGRDADGRYRARWKDSHRIHGIPYDMPMAGYGTNTVHTLRLWTAHATEQFDLRLFNEGDYRRAVERKALDEALTKVLYPSDSSIEGKRLRLEQQWFFVCCSVGDVLRRHLRQHRTVDDLPDKVALQLNDTHPALAVAELMRLLVDHHDLDWDQAWELTVATCGYTNHTLLPEALEKWSVDLFGAILPRHLQIIREIDRRFLQQAHIVSRGDPEFLREVAIVDERHAQIRMAHLATVGSHAVNGVARLHGQLLRDELMPQLAAMFPGRFGHQTNGVTPRRWLLQCNPALARLLTRRLGAGWERDLDRLEGLLPHEHDPELHAELAAMKRDNKVRLDRELRRWGAPVGIDPDVLLDVQVKRIHEYKRQLLCLLQVIWRYHQLLEGADLLPRTVLFGGKAAPAYLRAKQHVQLANDIARTVAADRRVQGRLQVLFVPDYDVTRAERIVPATDLSEQISLAGMEASGTGNMKFMMNGALTIGTLDGANVEMREAVGPDAFFLFGLDAAEVSERRRQGFEPSAVIAGSPRLRTVVRLLEEGFFDPEHAHVHREIARVLRQEDPFMVTADFDAYLDAQDVVDHVRADPAAWWSRVVRNIACSGSFSSDRTIRGYARDIWGLEPVQVDLRPLQVAPPSGSPGSGTLPVGAPK